MSDQTTQALLDSFEYPPNHQYNVRSLLPEPALKRRLQLLNEVAPGFFRTGKRLLDVGCNKGFFSLLAAKYCKQVVGVDSSIYTTLWKRIAPANVEFLPRTFQRYTPLLAKRFDRVFFGNVAYKFWKQSYSWDWVAKLATLVECGGQVLFEQPVDKNEGLLRDQPAYNKSGFTFKHFKDAMDPHFVLKAKVPHKQIKGRWIMLFERKPGPFDSVYQLHDLPPFKQRISRPNLKNSQIHEMQDGRICKLGPWDGRQTGFDMARLSPLSTGMEAVVYVDDKWAGWIERPIDEGSKFNKGLTRNQIFKQQCRHQIFLLRNGYFDFDPATGNFGLMDGKLVCFDKDAVASFEDSRPGRWVSYWEKVVEKFYPEVANRTDIKKLLVQEVESRKADEMIEAFIRVRAVL